jgi:hypothetical protein
MKARFGGLVLVPVTPAYLLSIEARPRGLWSKKNFSQFLVGLGLLFS